VQWILGRAGLAPGARVLDAPCGFGRHSVELARRGFAVTGVDFNETELARAREAAGRAGVQLTLRCLDMRDMESRRSLRRAGRHAVLARRPASGAGGAQVRRRWLRAGVRE